MTRAHIPCFGHARCLNCTTIFDLEHAEPSLTSPRVVAELHRLLNKGAAWPAVPSSISDPTNATRRAQTARRGEPTIDTTATEGAQ
jgi:hypothetical protein